MQEIKLRSDLIEKVLNGEKKAMTRLGLKSYTLGYVEFYNPENPKHRAVDFTITKLEAVAFCDITTELANLEGYANVDEFKAVLKHIYGHINDYATLTVVEFEPVVRSEDL